MKRLFLFLSLLSFSCAAFAVQGKDNEDILKQFDELLSKKGIYEQYLTDRVNILKSILDEQKDEFQIYSLNKRIAREFMSYSMDSTMAYLNANRTIAASLDDFVRKTETDIMIAYEYNIAGYYLEASEILRSINAESLPHELVRPYLEASHSLAGELLAYATDVRMFKEQDSLRTEYRNRLLGMTECDTWPWYSLKSEEALQYGKREEAREYIRSMVEVSEEGTHEYAIACYRYFEVSDDADERLEWLVRSASADVMCVTKDYAALNYLAQELLAAGDIDRAFEYATDHCMPDAIFFGGKLRPWQISSFFPEIGKAYQDKNDRWQKRMNAMFTVMSVLILMLAVLVLFIWLRQRVLEKTRRALQTSYIEIERQNMTLVEANRKLSELNMKISESDKVKQEYIALFLGILSENINTTRQYRNHVLKYIRHGNAKELASEIEMMPPIDEDITEFYRMFDRTFLNLYPDFVEKFNALLSEDEAIAPKGDDALTPELRVFALIKLGITDSSKIASLLHYSANTIYNYRAKIKNRARGDRAGFEDAVKMI